MAPAGAAGIAQPGAMRLEIKHVFKRFVSRDNPIEVLRDINLEVRSGEFIALVGASGCGKTTLLRIIDGLIPHDEGEISIDGRAVTGPGPDRGFVFPASFHGVPFATTSASGSRHAALRTRNPGSACRR
jgi:NitT/TauT family transport system ATP-binding protein